MLDGNVLLRQERDEVPEGTLSCSDRNMADFHRHRHDEGLCLLPSGCGEMLIQQTLIIFYITKPHLSTSRKFVLHSQELSLHSFNALAELLPAMLRIY